jgi:hypothetical protein
MKIQVRVKEDPVTKESYIDINDLSDFFEDLSLIDTCELKELGQESFSILFYDKDGNLLKLKNLDKKEE